MNFLVCATIDRCSFLFMKFIIYRCRRACQILNVKKRIHKNHKMGNASSSKDIPAKSTRLELVEGNSDIDKVKIEMRTVDTPKPRSGQVLIRVMVRTTRSNLKKKKIHIDSLSHPGRRRESVRLRRVVQKWKVGQG